MIHSDTEISAICQLLLDERILQQYLNQNSSDEDNPSVNPPFSVSRFSTLDEIQRYHEVWIQALEQAKLDDPFRNISDLSTSISSSEELKRELQNV